jgi:hypothetical protein
MKLNFLDNPIHKALLNENMSFHEVMNTFDIRTKIALNLPISIYGFVYVSKKGNFHIILNGNINYETQCNVFLHEIKHIIYDMPTIGYIIGLDMQHERFENEYMQIKKASD